MSPEENVRAFLDSRGTGLRVIHSGEDISTVETAAAALGVQPAQIAKTLAIRAKDRVLLVVARGDVRIDNAKFRDQFGSRPRMLPGPRRKHSRVNPSAESAPSDTLTPQTSTATSRCAASTPSSPPQEAATAA